VKVPSQPDGGEG